MSKYKIWNGTDIIYTYGPPYKFTPKEWMEQYPWAEITPCVISGEGAINGALCMPLANMISQAQKEGCDFSNCNTDEEKLDAIEAFEINRAAETAAKVAEAAMNEEMNAASFASIAASLEFQNMMSLPDEEV